MKLKEASDKELDELARSELESLLKQLKAQQDVDKKQNDLAERVKEQQRRLDQQELEIKELKEQIEIILSDRQNK